MTAFTFTLVLTSVVTASLAAPENEDHDILAEQKRGFDILAKQKRGVDILAEQKRGVDILAEQKRGVDILAEQKRSAATDYIRGLMEEVSKLENNLKTTNISNTKMIKEIQYLSDTLAKTTSHKNELENGLATVTNQLKELQWKSGQMERELRTILDNTNTMLVTCNTQLLESQKMIEDESVCPTFDASVFKCHNFGFCKTKINTFDHRMEPYCECRRKFQGRQCELGGDSENSGHMA